MRGEGGTEQVHGCTNGDKAQDGVVTERGTREVRTVRANESLAHCAPLLPLSPSESAI